MTVLLGAWGRVAGAAVVTLAAVSGWAAGPVTAAAASTGQAGSTSGALIRAFEAGRHAPGSAVGGIRAGSLHVGSAGGTRWALASFVPATDLASTAAGQRLAAGFQDGAGTGVFAWRAGAWQLVRTGPYGCATGLPAALRRDWGLASPASCAATAGGQRAAVHRAMSAAAAPSATAGGLGQRIAAIALSQAGVSDTPAVTSFAGVDCDPYSTLVAGFSANSDGCGYDQGFRVENENEAWCSDFAKWVWQRAGVTADMNTLNAGSVSFYDWGLDQGETMPVDGGTPAVGDAIVFFPPGTITPASYADHVGIVTAVNADGSIDMVNGDFLGAANISAQYDTGISLPSWSAGVWGAGEQWVIVSPPATVQQPAPAASAAGPRAAVTGTTGTFRAQGSEPGGTISEYYWTFGDGRTTNTTGPDVSHVFSEAGRYTVTVTVTSSFGTATTRTWNVRVLGASSAVAATASDAVWFASTPVDEYLFLPSAGGLAAETWDGASWLRLAVPGQPGRGQRAGRAELPGPGRGRRDDAACLLPHGRRGTGPDLPGRFGLGHPAAARPASGGQHDRGGHHGQRRSGRVLHRRRGAPGRDGAAGRRLADPHAAGLSHGPPRRHRAGRHGPRTADFLRRPHWHTHRHDADRHRLAEQSAAGPGGAGQLADRGDHAAGGGAGHIPQQSWRTGRPHRGRDRPVAAGPAARRARTRRRAGGHELPAAGWVPCELARLRQDGGTRRGGVLPEHGRPARGQLLGRPGLADRGAARHGGRRPPRGSRLPGDRPAIAAVPVRRGRRAAGRQQQWRAGRPWAQASLPTADATFTDRVVLYAATPADQASALSAAQAAGLPASQVTTSFAAAWDDTLSGNYLVISVGLAATDALYFNVCGWANPSGDIPGSTPFYIVSGPRDTLPGAGGYEAAAARTTAQTPQLAADLAYYAVHGTLPPGVSTLPAAAGPQYACAGSPS